MRYSCPVCGFKGLYKKPYRDTPLDYLAPASLEYCSCCAFQFGYHDDAADISFAQWRAEWIIEGMPWRGLTHKPPKNWDPREQFSKVDLTVERAKHPD